MIKTNSLTKIALFIVLFFIASNIIPAIHIGMIQITFQTAIIFMIPFFLNYKEIILWYLTLIILCLIGFPIMSHFSGGLGVLIGPTAGYIFGWLIKLLVIKVIINYNTSNKCIVIALFIGACIDLTIGGMFLSIYNQFSIINNIMISLASFLPIEIIKIIIVLVLIKRIPSTLFDKEVASEIYRTVK